MKPMKFASCVRRELVDRLWADTEGYKMQPAGNHHMVNVKVSGRGLSE